MKKYFIGMMILSTMLMLNTQIAQAKGNNGKVGTNIIEQTLQEFDFFELIGVCFKYILIFLVGNR